MGKRRKARVLALMMLYELEFRPGEGDRVLKEFWQTHPTFPDVQAFAESLVRGATEHAAEIDRLIAANAAHWSLARIAPVERNILRLAAYGIFHLDDLPGTVHINQV